MSPQPEDTISVLHVDEDSDYLTLVEEGLEREDFRFEFLRANSARSGLDILSERSVDCVVTGYDLPEMNDLEFLETVRETDQALPVILLTGKGSEEVASRAISAGVTDYLQKSSESPQCSELANRIVDSVSQNRASREVNETKTWFRKLLSESADFVFTVDEHGTIQYATPSVERVLGFSAEDLEGTNSFELIHPDDYERASREYASLLNAAGHETTTEFRAQRSDGTWRWLEVKGRNLHDDPVIDGIAVNVRDITERRERTQQLELYESMLETVPDGVYALDENLEYLDVNEALVELSGYSREKLVGSHLSILHDEDGVQSALNKREQLLDGDTTEVQVVEQTYHTKDGQEVPCEVRFRSLTGNDHFRGTAGVVRDVSERRAREQELQKLTEEYEALLEHADDDIFLINVARADSGYEFRFERLSPSHEATSGLTTENIRGKTPREVLGEETGAQVEENYRKCVEAREIFTYEEELPMPEGNIIWHTKLAPVIVDGAVTRVVGIARDMTERWEREQELQRKNERLDEFASVISHELRSPLSVAQGRIQLLKEDGMDDTGQNLEKITRAMDRMESILEDTLALARKGDTVSETDLIDIETVAQRCWNVVETEKAALDLGEQFSLKADRDRLRHILENLFRNAVEHSNGDVTVRIGRFNHDGFYVEDNGPGISEEKREQVFEAGHSTGEQGTGFGLTLVKRISEAHGWEVTIVEGTQGGARFEFSNVEMEG